jgi:hypothetical protein
VVAVVAAVTPEFGAESRYRYVDVGLGEPGRLREFDVAATGVRLTRAVQRAGEVSHTDQTYVVVTVETTARTRPQYLTNVELRTRDGRRYDPRPEWSTAEPPVTQPGFSSRGVVVFEVPPDRVAGAKLFVGPSEGEVTRFDAAVRADLGLDADAVPEPVPSTLVSGVVWVT